MKHLAWLVLAATGTAYAAIMLWSLPHLSALSGGLAMFDMRPFGYGYEAAHAILTALGEKGREFYLNVQQRLDTVFPPFAAASFVICFHALYRTRRWRVVVLSVVAILGAAFDLAENAAVEGLLHTGPSALSFAQVKWASAMTTSKSALNALSFIALLPGLVIKLRRFGRRYIQKNEK